MSAGPDPAGGAGTDPASQAGEGPASEAERAMADAMAGFRDRARATNLARVEVIADAVTAMRAGALDEELRVSARGAAHTLAGSAGTFGFAEASELGRALEALLDGVDDLEDPTVRAERGGQLVARLRLALADPEADAEDDPQGGGSATQTGQNSR